MKSPLARFFQTNPSSQNSTGVAKIRSLSDNLEYVPPEPGLPEHVIAHGVVMMGSQRPAEIKTAVRERGSDAEFSTNVGRVQNNLGLVLENSLNRKVRGKFVTLPSEQPRTSDVVFVTDRPTTFLNTTTFNSELAYHAKVKALADDILDGLGNMSLSSPFVEGDALADAVRQIIDNRIDEHRTLDKNRISAQYIPQKQFGR